VTSEKETNTQLANGRGQKRIVEDVYTCALCGNEAGSVRLEIDDTSPTSTLNVFGLTSHSTTWPKRERAELISQAIENGTARDLFELSDEYVPFFCPDCNACYCRKHWKIEDVCDDDFDNWYDASYGTCLRGHRRMVDD